MDERYLVYQARQAVYALLQRLYQNPLDAELMAWLTAERPFADFPVILDENSMAALEQMEQALQVTSLDALKEDFRQLFVGPGRMSAPAWESVYRNEERALFDIHTLQVRETYARHGIEFIHKNRTPEDSIAIELEFMKILAERLLQAVESQDAKGERILLDEQHAFLKQHLLVWTPQFTKRIQENAATPFYAGLGSVLRAFLVWDRHILEQLIADLAS
jgi:TorA maturation chaperone TorD